jgi:hypothetical protein
LEYAQYNSEPKHIADLKVKCSAQKNYKRIDSYVIFNSAHTSCRNLFDHQQIILFFLSAMKLASRIEKSELKVLDKNSETQILLIQKLSDIFQIRNETKG